MRPDRVASALTSYVSEMMDERYVEQPPFNIFETFKNKVRKMIAGFTLNAIAGAATASAPTIESLIF